MEIRKGGKGGGVGDIEVSGREGLGLIHCIQNPEEL